MDTKSPETNKRVKGNYSIPNTIYRLFCQNKKKTERMYTVG